MFLLTPRDVEITSIQHPKKNKKVPILSYEDKTFRLLSVFNSDQYAEANAAWRSQSENESKLCVLLEERSRYSIWRQVQIDAGLLQPAVAPAAYIKASVVIIQTLYSDIEQILGRRQAHSFGTEIERHATKQIVAAGGIGNILRLDVHTEELPSWEEDDLSTLLLALHRLGSQFFGRTKFTSRTIAALDELDPNDKTVFLNWLGLSLLGNLWLSTK